MAKVKSKYWICTHKFGIRVPKTVEEAKRLDQQNGNHLWWEAICKEMNNVRFSFDIFDSDVNDLNGNQFVECNMIFDIKMGKKF